MKNNTSYWKLTALSYALITLCTQVYAADENEITATPESAESTTADVPVATDATKVQTLPTLTFKAKAAPKDTDISAVAKTVVTREEMQLYGDQSVSDALRRATGFQMPTPGQGPRGGGGASGMRFRGGGSPTFLINGEPVQGGPRGGMSIIDNITTEMIERIEIVKQPSVAQASVASSAVINIILKEPLNDRIGGTVKLGYGVKDSGRQEEERKQLTVQADGRDDAWSYSVSANQTWSDTTSLTQTQSTTGTADQLRTTDRKAQMFSPRIQYELDDQQKLIAELFYRNNESNGVRGNQIQDDKNDSIRLNTRYERKDKDQTDKIRLSAEHQTETQLTRSPLATFYTDETVDEYGVGYDGVRKFDATKQLKFGFDARGSSLESNVAATLDEQRYALYGEGSWKFNSQQTITLGARQQWINRSGLVDYDDQHLSPVLAHRFDITPEWSLQTNLSRAFRSPNSDRLVPTVTVSTDSDAGSLNNPDRGGNPNLKPEKINAFESTLGYNTSAGGVNVTAYQREVKDYIEKAIQLEGTRFVERPQNQNKATTYGLEASGRYALKQTDTGHAFMLNAQVSTVHAEVEDHLNQKRLANDVAPYTASSGLSYSYKPWRLSTAVNVNYTPEFTRALTNQPYDRTTNQRYNVDLSATKRFTQGWATSLSLRNIFSTDYKERLTNQSDGSLYQARNNQAIPSALLTLEKTF